MGSPWFVRLEPTLLLWCGYLRFEDELVAPVLGPVDRYRVAGVELAADDPAGERVLDVPAYRPRERPGAELRVVALLCEELLGRVGDLDGDLLALEVLVEPAEQDRKSTRLNSSHANISYAVFCLKKK